MISVLPPLLLAVLALALLVMLFRQIKAEREFERKMELLRAELRAILNSGNSFSDEENSDSDDVILIEHRDGSATLIDPDNPKDLMHLPSLRVPNKQNRDVTKK